MNGMTSQLLSRRDLELMLYEWLDVEALTKASRFADHSRETFDAVHPCPGSIICATDLESKLRRLLDEKLH